MTYKEAKSNSKFLGVTVDGNMKLVNNDNLRFMVFNIPAVVTCPYRTAACEKLCYARKAEIAYPNVKKQREKNFLDTRKSDFVENMIFTVNAELATKKFQNKKVVFRIHESGDFYNKEYANKWLEIAAAFPSITFMAYTKSLVYFDGVTIPDNFVLRASIWCDSKPEFIAMAANYPHYTAVESFENYNGFKCRCDDCAGCGACWDKNIKSISCEIH